MTQQFEHRKYQAQKRGLAGQERGHHDPRCRSVLRATAQAAEVAEDGFHVRPNFLQIVVHGSLHYSPTFLEGTRRLQTRAAPRI